MIPVNTSIAGCMIAVAVLTAAAPGFCQNYPSRPIRIIVPFSAGGGSDILARFLGPRLSERIGQPVVVDNRPSGSGILGSDIVAKSVPDGYTLLLVQAAHAVNARLHTKLPYDPIKDFAPITLVISQPSGMFLHPSVPAKTVQEFIAHTKANPGKLNFGSTGPGSNPHLNAELFSSMAGIQMTHVPYKGAGQVVTALLSNEVQFAFINLVSTMAHWKAGRLRFIAHGGGKAFGVHARRAHHRRIGRTRLRGTWLAGLHGARKDAATHYRPAAQGNHRSRQSPRCTTNPHLAGKRRCSQHAGRVCEDHSRRRGEVGCDREASRRQTRLTRKRA